MDPFWISGLRTGRWLPSDPKGAEGRHKPGSGYRRGEERESARPRRSRISNRSEMDFRPPGKDAPNPTYLIINADEMEPGTFKDRFLLERNPHQLIEGAILQASRSKRHRLHLPARRIHAGRGRLLRGHRGGVRTAIWARTFWARAAAWNCICTAAPAATYAVTRPDC